MKIFYSILSFLFFCSNCKGQDGSDIIYISIKKLNSTIIDKDVHLDFYRKSYSGLNIDTIVIPINKKPIRFIEHREDDGFNNWFSRQYLEAIDTILKSTPRIASWRINKITKDSIFVKANFEWIFPKETLITDTFPEESYWFSKSIIKEILVKSKPFGSH